MRAILKFGLFLLAILLPTGCSSDDDEERLGIEITQVNVDDEVRAFFEKELTSFSDFYPTAFFVMMEGNAHFVINSTEEFQSIYRGHEQLPEIDFSKYTLIIGQQKKNVKLWKESTGEFLEQKLFQTEEGYQMYLYCKSIIPDAVLCSITYFYYWGLYPKQDIKDFTVNIKLVK